LNGDGEIDFIENFNNDHQVTEHFHEFAMGLQTDREGISITQNPPVTRCPRFVPHHGTLLKSAGTARARRLSRPDSAPPTGCA